MDNGLIGAIIGGSIAISGTIVTLYANHTRWKCEQRLQYLKNKRERLDKLFSEVRDTILKAYIDQSISISLISTIEIQFPEDVFQAIERLFMDDDRSKSAVQNHYMEICQLMEKTLAQIEKEIEKLVK